MRRPRPRHGFTLIEVLVALTIIAVLVALLLPAIKGAMRSVNKSSATAELGVIQQSLASFKARLGDYPPSRLVLSETGDYSAAFLAANLPAVQKAEGLAQTTRTVQALRTLFPRMTVSQTGPTATPTSWYDFNGDGKISPPQVIHGDECLVFFLGGVPVSTASGFGVTGFAKDPKNPFAPVSQNRTPGDYEFRSERLVDVNNNGFPEYADSIGGAADPRPIAYFAAYSGGYDPEDLNYNAENPGGFQATTGVLFSSQGPNPYTLGFPLPVDAAGNLVANGKASFAWQSPRTYQLISAGLDRIYGIGGAVAANATIMLPFAAAANGSVTGYTPPDRRDEKDNVTSFARTLE